MKSNIIVLNKNTSLNRIMREVENVAAYNHLEKKYTLRMRLFAEELISMLPNLLEVCRGELWIENEGKAYEIHTVIMADEKWSIEKEKILELSTSGKNIANTGIMGKIRSAAELMLAGNTAKTIQVSTTRVPVYYMGGLNMESHYLFDVSWSLQQYQASMKNQMEEEGEKWEEEWDELEKSIIGNIADDVIVGVRGKRVEIIIKKDFSLQ